MKKLTLLVLSSLLVTSGVFAQNKPVWTPKEKEDARQCTISLFAELRKMDDLYKKNFEKLTSAQRSNYFSPYRDLNDKAQVYPDTNIEFSKSIEICNGYVASAKKVSAELNSVITAKNQEADQRFLPLCIAGWRKLYWEYVDLQSQASDKKAIPVGPKFDDLDRRFSVINAVMTKNGRGEIDDAKECKKAWNDQTALNADMKKSIADGLAAQSVKKDVKK